MHCTATFYGPLIAPNTGILAYQTIDENYAGFRIALTGTALEQRATPQAVKKLKLTGTPMKIFKNTAFITGNEQDSSVRNSIDMSDILM